MGFLSRVVAPLCFAYDSPFLNKATTLKKEKEKYILLQLLGFFAFYCCNTYSKPEHKTILHLRKRYTTSVSWFLQSVSFMALETLKEAVMITFSKSGLTNSGVETIQSVSWRGNPAWL